MIVARTMINNKSSANILFKSSLERMGLGTKDLETCERLIYRFTESGMAPAGLIKLPLKVRIAPKSVTIMALFVVLDIVSPYNALIGRPALYDLKAVTSIFHLLVQFPTKGGIGCLKGNQMVARECYNLSITTREKVAKSLKATTKLEEVPLDPKQPSRLVKIGKELSKDIRSALIQFLRENQDVFAWSHKDMEGISPTVISHTLNIDVENFKPVQQKRRLLDKERAKALKEKVEKLWNNNFIKEAYYPVWVLNPILVPKSNGTWRISMHPPDQEHTSFRTDVGLYFYKVMTFGLKNAGATYQRLVNRMFKEQIGRNMEVYVDDMLVKSKKA
ncbi:uncharacterized protein LOC133034532 [Cannabis sativa]|uniref:uncharacterized protein LOC133034532 n=1 Tax=Cannabis sativa TaxID=3483 RepID=UPI0029C9CEF3|nr:uncharacterized protein LOC133034532 [Cannabis sativa]